MNTKKGEQLASEMSALWNKRRRLGTGNAMRMVAGDSSFPVQFLFGEALPTLYIVPRTQT